MKKLSKINLHNLSHAEITDREQKLLKGGKEKCACVGVCMGDSCQCDEVGDSGLYPLKDNNRSVNDNGVDSEREVSGVWAGNRNEVN